ncbi:mCG144726, partial [Mus musculus]
RKSRKGWVIPLGNLFVSWLPAGACTLAKAQSLHYSFDHKRRNERKNTFIFHQAITKRSLNEEPLLLSCLLLCVTYSV